MVEETPPVKNEQGQALFDKVTAFMVAELQTIIDAAKATTRKGCLDCGVELSYDDYPHYHCPKCVQHHIAAANPMNAVDAANKPVPRSNQRGGTRPPIARDCKTCGNQYSTRGYGVVDCSVCVYARQAANKRKYK